MTPFVRNKWNGTLHKPLQNQLKRMGVRVVNDLPPINEINKHYDVFFCDSEIFAKGWTAIKIPKVMFMEDVWSPHSTKRKGRSAGRIYKYADALMIRYKSMFYQKMEKLDIRWRQPIYHLPHCIDPKIFNNWKQKKDIGILSVGTFMHKSTKGLRTYFYETAKKVKTKTYRAKADRYLRQYTGKNFSKIINRAKITGTTNTVWQVLAKCMEIPASYSCMFCNYSHDMEELGFVDDETYVLWNEKNLKEKLEYYLKNPNELQRITENGYKVVHEKHTVQVRAQEWMAYIKDMMDKI